jgi:hypothetical protein
LAYPDDWENSLDSFLAQYLSQHDIFLQTLKEFENEKIRCGALSESERLSGKITQSIQNGNFWFCLAATSSFAFNDIY